MEETQLPAAAHRALDPGRDVTIPRRPQRRVAVGIGLQLLISQLRLQRAKLLHLLLEPRSLRLGLQPLLLREQPFALRDPSTLCLLGRLRLLALTSQPRLLRGEGGRLPFPLEARRLLGR